MPRKCHMSYEGAPKYRWVKMHKGTRYRVTCEELGAKVWTQEATLGLANAWWESKLAEITGPSPVARVIQAVDDIPIDKLREMMERGNAVRQILAELSFVKMEPAAEEVARIVGSPVAQGEEAEKLQEVVAKVTQPHSAVAPNRTFKHQAERFLAFVRGSVKPLSYRNLGKFVGYLIEGKCPGLTPGMDVSSIDPEAVERVFLFLREGNLDNQTRKTRWAWFKRLIRYFWESEMMELPRNLDSPALKFKVAVKAIKTWSAEEVRACLGTLPPRMQLWALLGLNCGMTNVDIGSLRKDQVNLKTGRLVRKRVKTETHELVPTVDYRLWPETLKLLKEHWSKHPELGLTSSDGTSLYTSWFEGKNTRKKDLLALAWRRAKVSIPLKAFRSISATLLESHAAYGRYKSHFLGHSPKGIADKHYAAPSGELFDTILVWLHDQIFKK